MTDPTPSKNDAQRRTDRIKIFGEELAQLAREKVVALTPDQRRTVAEHHAALAGPDPDSGKIAHALDEIE